MITFSGLASGLDSASIIDQLVSLERAPANRAERRKSGINQQLSIVADLGAKLRAVATEMDSFKDASSIRETTATSSQDSKIAVSSSGPTATPGTYLMRVTSLAAAETSVSRKLASADAGMLGTGSVGIAVGTDAQVTVSYGASDSLHDVANRINDSAARVSASVLFDGSQYQLMITSDDSGTANAITFQDSGDSLQLAAAGAQVVDPSDAIVVMNGVTISRSTNTLADVVPGVTLSLLTEHAVGDLDTKITVAHDANATRDKVQKFIDSYNKVVDALAAQLTYTGTTKGENTLFGDATLRGLQNKLASLTTAEYAHGTGKTSLGQLGIERDNAGKLSIDSAQFEAQLAADPTALGHLFGGSGGDGLAKIFQDTVDAYTRTGDGILTAKTQALSSRVKVFDEQIERIEASASSLEERLTRQFAALERAMLGFQSQRAFLSSF